MSDRATRPLWLAALIAALLGGVLGGLVVANTLGDPQAERAALGHVRSLHQLDDRIEELGSALDREVEARNSLAFEVSRLRAALELMTAVPAPPAEGEAVPEEAAEPEADTTRSPEAPAGFQPGRLRELGLGTGEIDRLEEEWGRYELARLEVQDQALREGWYYTRRHRDALAALDAELREKLGAALYDDFLYATGSPNRVVVQHVIRGSAADAAGLASGDVIVAYEGAPVFRPRDIQRATAAGQRGESVELEVDRSGRRLYFRVPRGPLGILLGHVAGVPLRR